VPGHPSFTRRFAAWVLVFAVIGAGGIRGHGDADAGKSVAARTSAVLRVSSCDANAFIACHTLLAKPFPVPEAGRETTTMLDLFPRANSATERSGCVRLRCGTGVGWIAAVKPTLVGIVELRI